MAFPRRYKIFAITWVMGLGCSLLIAAKLATHYGWPWRLVTLITTAPLAGPWAYLIFLPESYRPSFVALAAWCLLFLAMSVAHPIAQRWWAVPLTVAGIVGWFCFGISGVYEGV